MARSLTRLKYLARVQDVEMIVIIEIINFNEANILMSKLSMWKKKALKMKNLNSNSK